MFGCCKKEVPEPEIKQEIPAENFVALLANMVRCKNADAKEVLSWIRHTLPGVAYPKRD